jgi:hypothetical protein
MEEGSMKVVAALEANEEATVAVQPGEATFDDPAVAAEFGAGVDARPGDPRRDVSATEGRAARAASVGLVSMQLVRASARPATRALDGWDSIDDVKQDRPLVDIGGGQEADQGDTLSVGYQMVFGPWSATIGRVRANGLGQRPPFFSPLPGTVELSMLARLQSIRSASPKRSSKARCRAHQTPASCQSRSRRQHVIPLPHPISCGRYSHWMPVFNTNTIPVKQARSGTRGRPAFFFGRGFGNNGATTSHNSSLTSVLAMQHTPHGLDHFC